MKKYCFAGSGFLAALPTAQPYLFCGRDCLLVRTEAEKKNLLCEKQDRKVKGN